MLLDSTSAHNPLMPVAPLSGICLLRDTGEPLEFIALQALIRRDSQIPGACQKGKVLPLGTKHEAVRV